MSGDLDVELSDDSISCELHSYTYTLRLFGRLGHLDLVASEHMQDAGLFPAPWRHVVVGPVWLAWKLSF
jgi:hypothetical protein